MSSCCHFSSRSSGVWEGNMFQWSSCDPQSQRERDLCRISSSLTGEDPALMYGTMTSIIKQSAGSLRRLIGSSITGCDQSHLFLSSAQLSPTDKMEVKAAEHKKHQKDKVSICTRNIWHQFSFILRAVFRSTCSRDSEQHKWKQQMSVSTWYQSKVKLSVGFWTNLNCKLMW